MQVAAASRLYCDGYGVSSVFQSNKFRTHVSENGEKLHAVSEFIGFPGRWAVQLLAHVIEPLSGENKENFLRGIIIRIGAFAFFLIILPFGVVSFLSSLALRCIDHGYRPGINYMVTPILIGREVASLQLSEANPLHVRTHNVGFVTTAVSTIRDLRHPVERAYELVHSILRDLNKPDVIFFQETFHEDATRVLCEGIRWEYPYIVHTVAPQITGFSSGVMVASKYPIEEVEFKRFSHMLGPELLSPRGILRVKIGSVYLYGVHTQALIGEERAEARYRQLEDVKNYMNETQGNKILLGDFNTSRVTAWGEDNEGQAEERVYRRLTDYFNDIYLKDHNPVTGERICGRARFQEMLAEPRGSWYYGPFASRGWILSLKMWLDRYFHNREEPRQIIQLSENSWGTSRWYREQPANTARFDYILVPNRENNQSGLEGIAEIRRVSVPLGTQSAPSDHLPVDGLIWGVSGMEDMD